MPVPATSCFLPPLLMVRPFPKETEKAANTAQEDGEDMYQALENLVGQSIRCVPETLCCQPWGGRTA